MTARRRRAAWIQPTTWTPRSRSSGASASNSSGESWLPATTTTGRPRASRSSAPRARATAPRPAASGAVEDVAGDEHQVDVLGVGDRARPRRAPRGTSSMRSWRPSRRPTCQSAVWRMRMGRRRATGRRTGPVDVGGHLLLARRPRREGERHDERHGHRGLAHHHRPGLEQPRARARGREHPAELRTLGLRGVQPAADPDRGVLEDLGRDPARASAVRRPAARRATGHAARCRSACPSAGSCRPAGRVLVQLVEHDHRQRQPLSGRLLLLERLVQQGADDEPLRLLVQRLDRDDGHVRARRGRSGGSRRRARGGPSRDAAACSRRRNAETVPSCTRPVQAASGSPVRRGPGLGSSAVDQGRQVGDDRPAWLGRDGAVPAPVGLVARIAQRDRAGRARRRRPRTAGAAAARARG